jgi:hypothetical protein
MKKILILLPIIGICSSLFAQAPKVENINAQQKEGTKFVIITADVSGKDEAGFGAAPMFFEVWFKQTAAETTWRKVSNLSGMANEFDDPSSAVELTGGESFDPVSGTYQKVSFQLNEVGSALVKKVFVWNAGAESEEFKSADAVIRIIAFYPKSDEFGTEHPMEQQVSGWDGMGEFTLGGDPAAN